MQQILLDYDPEWINLKLEQLFRAIKEKYPKLYFHIIEEENWHPQIVLTGKKVSLKIYISRDADLSVWKNAVLVHFSLDATSPVYKGCGSAVNNFKDFNKELEQYINKFNKYVEEYKCYQRERKTICD